MEGSERRYVHDVDTTRCAGIGHRDPLFPNAAPARRADRTGCTGPSDTGRSPAGLRIVRNEAKKGSLWRATSPVPRYWIEPMWRPRSQSPSAPRPSTTLSRGPGRAPALADELQGEATGAGAHIHFPTQEDQRIDLAVAVSWADRVERDDQAHLAEMNRWLRDPEVHAIVDGIPVEAIPHIPSDAPRHADVPLPDFEVGVTGKLLIERDVDEQPLIAIVRTDGDNPIDHLQAGRAMIRLMLAAELRGLSTCVLSQAADFAAVALLSATR